MHAGTLDAKKAAAEGLTNLAACSSLVASSSATPTASSGQAGRTHEQSRSSDSNPKVEVQRAGAIAPLLAMLRQQDEGCIQASATALYVLAEEEENRAVMQGSGVREALQSVLALSKAKPPKVSHKTRADCEQAVARMLA